MRFFLELSYNGTNYHGWQRQKGASSVQQTIEETLSRLLGQCIELTGAGRTDTGVHAAYYVAHFDILNAGATGTCSDIITRDNGVDFLYHANSVLPPDVALRSVQPVPDTAHARYDAIEREYTYYIIPFKDPFRIEMAWQYSVPLDIDAMNEAAAHLLTASDFTSFAKLGSDNKTNICHITVAKWDMVEGCVLFTIRADRFLRNMVRAIVGTLVDVGRGKITPERFAEILAARDLSLSSGGAPARGLFLTDVTYPDLRLKRV